MSKAEQLLNLEDVRERLNYDPETGLFTRRYGPRLGRPMETIKKVGYAQVSYNKAIHLAHRLAWFYVHGEWPSGHVDHINGLRADNRIANLRVVTNQVNSQNRHKPQSNNTTGYLGVARSSTNRFRAVIGAGDRRTRHIGTFVSAEEAHAAYLEAKRRLHHGCTI